MTSPVEGVSLPVPVDVARLRELARQAAASYISGSHQSSPNTWSHSPISDFRAAMSPDVVTALCDEIERLQACDCAASEDGNPHHQGFCRALTTADKRERSWRTAQTIAQLTDHGRDAQKLARDLADSRDETAAALDEVESWRDKWAIVDQDRCEAQDERDIALARAVAAEAAIARVRELHRKETVEGYDAPCVTGDCEHESTGECPTRDFDVCAECYSFVEALSGFADSGECWPGTVLWPCATAAALSGGAT